MHNIASDFELKADLYFQISYDENEVMKNCIKFYGLRFTSYTFEIRF